MQDLSRGPQSVTSNNMHFEHTSPEEESSFEIAPMSSAQDFAAQCANVSSMSSSDSIRHLLENSDSPAQITPPQRRSFIYESKFPPPALSALHDHVRCHPEPFELSNVASVSSLPEFCPPSYSPSSSLGCKKLRGPSALESPRVWYEYSVDAPTLRELWMTGILNDPNATQSSEANDEQIDTYGRIINFKDTRECGKPKTLTVSTGDESMKDDLEEINSPKYAETSRLSERQGSSYANFESSKLFKILHKSNPPPPPRASSKTDAAAKSAKAEVFSMGFRTMTVELHVRGRKGYLPNPRLDPVDAICLLVVKEDTQDHSAYVGIVENRQFNFPAIANAEGILVEPLHVFSMQSEQDLFLWFVRIVTEEVDPDILMGFEIQQDTLGYLVRRYDHLGFSRLPLQLRLGRVLVDEMPLQDDAAEKDAEGSEEYASDIRVPGRVCLNLWRVFRSELKLSSYSLQRIVLVVLSTSLPSFTAYDLAQQFSSSPWTVISFLLRKCATIHTVLVKLDVVTRTQELARVIGIDFYSVLSRGSQFRVESIMLRLAKPKGFVFLSASKEQVANQVATECLPLVMEPKSSFYPDPVIVFDFQSLYPSMMIAYNICFSTCLGRLSRSRTKKLGVMDRYDEPESGVIRKLMDDGKISIAPNGVMYATRQHLKGILPEMLEDILNTRIMLKQAIRDHPDEKRSLNAQQFALKLIANVTYGYTAVSFSGRMPCAEVADSIVQFARETLEDAIRDIESGEAYAPGASQGLPPVRVVYGDTDSLFVLCPGRSREAAFEIGRAISRHVTVKNPYPVKLAFEKVFHPCILVTKKRYVGYSWESEKQEKPIFVAKGIESVRRDSCPLVQETMDEMLRLLFVKRNIHELKTVLESLFLSMASESRYPGSWFYAPSDRISLSKYIFAKEVRVGAYAPGRALPPAALVARRMQMRDPMFMPKNGERVHYLVVCPTHVASMFQHENAAVTATSVEPRLIDCILHPFEYFRIPVHRRPPLHVLYYAGKQVIPAVGRLFKISGFDVVDWYEKEMRPKMLKEMCKRNVDPSITGEGSATLDSYFLRTNPRETLLDEEELKESERSSEIQKVANHIVRHRVAEEEIRSKCLACCSAGIEETCIALECPVWLDRTIHRNALSALDESMMW
nr:DNA polymerase zeta catalytic subunit [Andalucia godoyi]